MSVVALDQLVALVVWVAPKAATTAMEYILTVEILTAILTIRIVMEVSTTVNGPFYSISEKGVDGYLVKVPEIISGRF